MQYVSNQKIDQQANQPTNQPTKRAIQWRARDLKKTQFHLMRCGTRIASSAPYLSFQGAPSTLPLVGTRRQEGKAHIYPEGPEANFAEVALFLSLIRFRGKDWNFIGKVLGSVLRLSKKKNLCQTSDNFFCSLFPQSQSFSKSCHSTFF